ncbi:MAG: SUMF1/EgtB/PvdO family nonheme iron enzyme [Myxococcales bacterium]
MPELTPEFLAKVLDATSPQGDPSDALVLADAFLERGEPRRAAAALDRAFGLAPNDPDIARQRAAVLESLALVEHGLRFRFVPGGPFLMGSAAGDPDERPVHVARTGDFWIADVPLTWAAYCDLLGWKPPPDGSPKVEVEQDEEIYEANQMRLQYCETETVQAGDWHAHAPAQEWTSNGQPVTSTDLFGTPPRTHPDRPYQYDVKPLIAVSFLQAERLRQRLATPALELRLPTEDEWEKAARGGLIGAKYSWGHAPPDPARCDFGHFGEFVIHDPRRYPPNGYGLHAMCGTVMEWTSDVYDALTYRNGRPDPTGWVPPNRTGQAPRNRATLPPRVVRGGSWSDCAEACTVSFRCSQDERTETPSIGLRLVRCERR